MKLRIRGSSVRVRLTGDEVERFGREGAIEEHCAFGAERLTYALVAGDGDGVRATMTGGRIEIAIPREVARAWCAGEIGKIEGDGVPSVLIERDLSRR